MTKSEFEEFLKKYKKKDEIFCLINNNISKTLAQFGGGGVMTEMAELQKPYRIISASKYGEYFVIEYDLETSFYFHYEDISILSQEKDIVDIKSNVKFDVSNLPKNKFFSIRKPI